MLLFEFKIVSNEYLRFQNVAYNFIYVNKIIIINTYKSFLRMSE